MAYFILCGLCLFGCFTSTLSWQIYIDSLLTECLTLRFPDSYLEKIEACFIVKSGHRHCQRVIEPRFKSANIVSYPYICGWMVPTTTTTNNYHFSYKVLVYESFVIKLQILTFNLDYSASCVSQYLQVQSCDNAERVTRYCGHRRPWSHLTGNNSMAVITSGVFDGGIILYRAFFEIVDKNNFICSPVTLHYRDNNVSKAYDFTLNGLTSSKLSLTDKYYYQIRTAPYRRIYFIVNRDLIKRRYIFHDGPGIKSPLVHTSRTLLNNSVLGDLKLMSSSFQLFIIVKDINTLRKDPLSMMNYTTQILPYVVASGGCGMEQTQSPFKINMKAILPRQGSPICALFFPPQSPGYSLRMSYNVTINYFEFTGDDMQYSDVNEHCPMGGQYIYRSTGDEEDGITLVHDGCHTDKSYSMNFILDYFYVIFIAFPRYSSLSALLNIKSVSCQVFLNPCSAHITKIMMAPETCAAILETPFYSSHLLANECRYNLSDADIMTGSAALSLSLLYPNFKPQICLTNNSDCSRYSHTAYLSSDWPQEDMDIQQNFTYFGGSSNNSVHYFRSLNFIEISYWQGGVYSRTALFSLYLRKITLCGVSAEGDLHLHGIFASSSFLSNCRLQQTMLPTTFRKLSLRLQTIQNKDIIHHVKKTSLSHYLKIDSFNVTVDPLSVSIYYDACFLLCVNDTVRVTEYDAITKTILTHVWRPTAANYMWVFQNLITLSGLKIHITRHVAVICGFMPRCRPYIQQENVEASPLKSTINEEQFEKVGEEKFTFDNKFAIFPNR